MADKDITQIHVGQYVVSIVGLKQVISELSQTHSGKPDDEVLRLMLERLGQDNYIPAKVRAEYGKAFVREFRKALGQPYEEAPQTGLDVKVLGAGCSQCHALTQLVMEVLNELELPAGVEHVTDIQTIARYGIMGSPALLINGKAVAVGSVPPRDRIKRWLTEAHAAQAGR